MTYRAVNVFFMQSVLMLMLLTAMPNSQAHAALTLTHCDQKAIALESYLQAYIDTNANKTLAEIVHLPKQLWQSADKRLLTPGFTHSSYWYQISIDNQAQSLCRLWIDLGTVRVTDVQMYSQKGNAVWQAQHVGTAYPVSEWISTQRIPSLPVALPPAATTHILLRVSSPYAFAINPQLLSPQGLIKKRMTAGLTDGVIFGVVGLLVVLSLLIGYLFRLKILIVHALMVFSYTLYLVLVAGYAFVYLWPDAVRWNAQTVMFTDIVTHVLVLSFVGVLLQVKDQPKRIRLTMLGAQLSLLVLLALRLTFPEAQWLDEGSVFTAALRVWGILAILAALLTGTQQKLAYNWFSYFASLFIVVESMVLLLFSFGISTVAPLEYAWLTASALPVALLLFYTLISQIALIRQRENIVLADIEQLKLAEHEILEQRVGLRTQQLRDALRNQNMLLARISHDLRSPLQQVIRDSCLLQESTEHAARYGQSIQRAARQQLDLIDELLEFSQGELKQLELLLAPGYLFGFLREIEESGVFLAERNSNTFNSDLANDLPLLVNADFRRLRQVLINLLANAAKFTQEGQIDFSVSLEGFDKNAGHADVRFMVSDNGMGIPKEQREHLLEPFQRGENSARYEGVGLGLYIVRQLLDSMQSELNIEESKSAGVCCHFTLRLDLAAEQELEQVFIESYSASSEGQQRCVLIVDDVAITQEMLYELLAGYNYNPITCSSVAEALVILRDHPIDIIITDQVMPIMDGWDLLRNVRREWLRMPILLYSARPPVRPLGLDASIEFDACLLKPSATHELLAQINRLLN